MMRAAWKPLALSSHLLPSIHINLSLFIDHLHTYNNSHSSHTRTVQILLADIRRDMQSNKDSGIESIQENAQGELPSAYCTTQSGIDFMCVSVNLLAKEMASTCD
jgi:hypothetical protein